MGKAESIRSVIAKMLAVYGHAVRVIDYWPDDPLAVGIASTDAPDLLVYIASYSNGEFHLSFENSPGPDERAAGFPYHSAGTMNCHSLEDVTVAVGTHLRAKPLVGRVISMQLNLTIPRREMRSIIGMPVMCGGSAGQRQGVGCAE